MKKIIASEMITLDGFFSGLNGEMDWFTMDEEHVADSLKILNTVGTIFYGRQTYQMMVHFWPNSTGLFADKTNELTKIIFSNSLQSTPWGKWNNAIQINENVIETVKKIKGEKGDNIIIYGSGTIVQLLTKHNLIDEFHFYINPVILGQGKKLFAEIENRINLNLISSKKYKSGLMGFFYEPKK